MPHPNTEKSFKIKALVNDIANKAAANTKSLSNGAPVNAATSSRFTSMLLAVAIGSRKLPDTIVTMCSEDAVGTVQREAVLSLISEIGEAIFLNHQDVLSWSQKVLETRLDGLLLPCCFYNAMSIKDFAEATVPGSSNFVHVNLERTLGVINEYIETYYTE